MIAVTVVINGWCGSEWGEGRGLWLAGSNNMPASCHSVYYFNSRQGSWYYSLTDWISESGER